MRPLEGIVVLDLTRLLPGEAAVKLLASFGAEIVPVKKPAYDLKTPAGKAALFDLADRADILIESFRPGVMASFGAGYATLSARNLKLIYAAITGYGQSGPYAHMAGHDINYLALSGVLDLAGNPAGRPAIPGVQIADLAGGSLQAVVQILAALAERQRTGRGSLLDISMLHGSLWLLPVPLALRSLGLPTARGESLLTGRYACYNLYETAGGRWLAVGALEPKFWANLCRALQCEQFIAGQFDEGARQQEIIQALASIFRTRPAEEWFQMLKDCDACVTPVRSLDEVTAEFADELPKLPDLSGVEGI